MEKNKMLAYSIFCLAISIVISAVIIAKGMKSHGDYVNGGLYNISQRLGTIGVTVNNAYNGNGSSYSNSRGTYDLANASRYLGISEASLKEIIETENSGIPYVKMGGNYIFSKDALDKWMETARVDIK